MKNAGLQRSRRWTRGDRYEYVGGDPKHWDLSECLRRHFGSDNPPERANLEFLIALRNKIEHRHVPELDPGLYGECQAALLNLETLLSAEFGARYALSEQLAVSLQFSGLIPAEKRKAAGKLALAAAKNVREYVEKFRAGLPSATLNSTRYSFNVYLVPRVANRKQMADAAVEFIRVDEASTEELERLEVVPLWRLSPIKLPPEAGIQDVFRHLATDQERTKAIAAEVKAASGQGRKVLVLTERTEHLDAIRNGLDGENPTPLVMHGRMSRKQRGALVAELDALPADAPRILLATGKLVGEGFDHSPLDTLVLAMTISWKGTLQQYAGRLHREHAGKSDVRIIDFVDAGHPALLRMWERRQRGYRAMRYRIGTADSSGELDYRVIDVEVDRKFTEPRHPAR